MCKITFALFDRKLEWYFGNYSKRALDMHKPSQLDCYGIGRLYRFVVEKLNKRLSR